MSEIAVNVPNAAFIREQLTSNGGIPQDMRNAFVEELLTQLPKEGMEIAPAGFVLAVAKAADSYKTKTGDRLGALTAVLVVGRISQLLFPENSDFVAAVKEVQKHQLKS